MKNINIYLIKPIKPDQSFSLFFLSSGITGIGLLSIGLLSLIHVVDVHVWLLSIHCSNDNFSISISFLIEDDFQWESVIINSTLKLQVLEYINSGSWSFAIFPSQNFQNEEYSLFRIFGSTWLLWVKTTCGPLIL